MLNSPSLWKKSNFFIYSAHITSPSIPSSSPQFFYLKTILRHPTVNTKHKYLLKFKTSAFLMVVDFFTLNRFRSENSFLVKKNIFSFSYKNDMQRFLMRRYLKNRFIYFLQAQPGSFHQSDVPFNNLDAQPGHLVDYSGFFKNKSLNPIFTSYRLNLLN
jgi:hypothetical protein